MIDQSLIEELSEREVNHNAKDIVAIETASDGKILFIEKGDSRSGLAHIIARHGDEFKTQGISTEQVPQLIMAAVMQGSIVGTQGSRLRPIYEVVYNGMRRRIAIEISDNGYIVSANPRSLRR